MDCSETSALETGDSVEMLGASSAFEGCIGDLVVPDTSEASTSDLCCFVGVLWFSSSAGEFFGDCGFFDTSVLSSSPLCPMKAMTGLKNPIPSELDVRDPDAALPNKHLFDLTWITM